MKKREISPEQFIELERFAVAVENKTVYRRLQCVLLRAKTDWTREKIAEATGYTPRHVERVQSEYFERGLAAFERKARVQNPRQYLSPIEESEFLHSLESEAEAGVLIGAKVVQGRLTERLQHAISLSAVYGLLHRNGWSKQSPRPKHPKGDDEAKVLFKKIC